MTRRSTGREVAMPVGKTRDAGWQIGVSCTVPYPATDVWEVLTSPRGLAAWLGEGVELGTERGTPYRTAEGAIGEIRSFRPLDRIRLTWQPPGDDHETTVQVALDDRGERTGVRFHQERMRSASERERRRGHWKGVAAALREVIDDELG